MCSTGLTSCHQNLLGGAGHQKGSNPEGELPRCQCEIIFWWQSKTDSRFAAAERSVAQLDFLVKIQGTTKRLRPGLVNKR